LLPGFGDKTLYVIRTKRLAKSAVVISFIEASLSFPVYIDLLDVGATERLTALI
jgi:hypothetical protein